MTPPTPGSVEIARLVAGLGDVRNAVPAGVFPVDPTLAKHPGLYAWWADAEGLGVLSTALDCQLSPLIYAGLAGATHWPSGKASAVTLWARVGQLHLRGNIRGSTFRRTLAAILRPVLGLGLTVPDRLTNESEARLSAWMVGHLLVAIQPYPGRATLGAMERSILGQLDPPLNLDGMAPSPVRRRVRVLRHELSKAEGGALGTAATRATHAGYAAD